MDALSGILGVVWVLPVIVIIAVLVAALLYVRSRWKVAKADQAIVVTGGKKGMVIRVAGGAFVSPLRKHQFFPLGVMTVSSPDQETQSKTLVPVVVKWTAQLRPDTSDTESLEAAVMGFIDRSTDEIKDSLQQTLDGEVRAVVATLTPQEVVTNKEKFSTDVANNVSERMTELGYKLVSLNIAEVSDKKGYYDNLAAEDREEQRRIAEIQIADANREVAVAKAASDRVSESAGLDKDLAITEKNRQVSLRKAEIKSETDAAETNARYVGQLAEQDREAELAARRGHVSVVEQQQAQASAIARREVAVAEAETQKREREIEAEADARRTEIEAEAQSRKSQIDAEAAAEVKTRAAKAGADAAIQEARGEAESTTAKATAEAERTRQTGLAEAEVARAQGEAEAESILAKGRAEAEVQKLLADALAANEGVSLQVRIAEIQRDTTIAVYDGVTRVMSNIGEKAQFIDMGAGSREDGDILTKVMGNIPKLLKGLDVESGALHGTSLGSLVGSTFAAMRNSPATSPKSDSPSHEGQADKPAPETDSTSA